jgi:hypothetical protein
MSRSHMLLHCPNTKLVVVRVQPWEGKDPGGIRVLLANPRWEKRFLKFLELSGVGRVMAYGTDEEGIKISKRWKRDFGRVLLDESDCIVCVEEQQQTRQQVVYSVSHPHVISSSNSKTREISTDGARAARMDEWIVWETVEKVALGG